MTLKSTGKKKHAQCRTKHNRANFVPAVKRIVAARSGYECSYPGCGALTIGPGRGEDTVSITGVAAHIYSAAPTGPRGQSNLSHFELSTSSNAMWLCETHGKLIDNNRGTDYPPAVLTSYKGFHEAAIMRRHMGLNAPLGWFHEIQILRGPLFRTPTAVRFGKFTILSGRNSIGKTALWQWLSLISGSAWGLSRWRRAVGKNPPLSLDITYFNPIKNVVGIRMSETGEVSFLLNGDCVPYIPMPTRFVVIVRPDRGHLRDHEKEAWETWSDVERISAALHIDVMELENIFPYVGDSGRFVQKVWVEEGSSSASEDDQESQRSVLKVKLQTHGNFFPSFGMLSGGEQVYVLIEIGIAIARFSARYVPTILILDTFRTLDSAGQKEWARYLSEPEHLFQTIVEAHLDLNLAEMASSAAWEVVTLEGKPPSVEIHQIGATE